MTDDPTPTTLRRQLGAQLRELRQAKGLTATRLAQDLGFSESKISRLESGARAVSQADLAKLINYFGVDPARAQELDEIAHSARRRRGAWVDVMTADAGFHGFVKSGFVELERDAVYVREFNEGIVPGLLQTAEYMQAIVRSAASDPEVVRRAIELRRSRQQRLARPGEYAVIVDEAALLREVGGPQTMAGQLDHILGLADAGVVDVMVLPLSAGYHPGLNSSFVALTMNEDAPDAAFVEGVTGFQQFDSPDDYARFDRVWAQLAERAPSREASRALMVELRDSFRRRAG